MEGCNGERTFQYFSDYTSCYIHTCSPPRQEEEEGTPQLLRPHEVPKFNTDFHRVIPAAILTFSLIFCRHRSSFLGEETPSDSPGREAQTPAPMLPLAFLPACEKGAQTAPGLRDSPSISLGTLPQVPPDLGEAPLAPHGVPAHPFTAGSSPIHPREQPLYASGSCSQFRKHLPAPQNSPHLSEHAPVYIPHLKERIPFTSEHPTLQGTPLIHLSTPSSFSSAPSERRPEAPPYLLRRQLHMQGASGGAGRQGGGTGSRGHPHAGSPLRSPEAAGRAGVNGGSNAKPAARYGAILPQCRGVGGAPPPARPLALAPQGRDPARPLQLRLAQPDANQRPAAPALSNRRNARRRRLEHPLPEGGTAPDCGR